MFIQFIISTAMIILTSIFPTLAHPLSMGLVILLLTILLAVSLGLFSTNFWLSYVLVLVLLGGLLVIFIYISLLASNELFSTKNNFKIIFLSILMSSTLVLSNLFFWSTKESSHSPLNYDNEGLLWLNALYSQDLMGATLFLVFYLFLTLIVVVNITKNDYSSLRAH